MKTKTEAIKELLKYSSSPLAKLYTPEMECQVMVAQDDGIRYTGQYKDKTFHGFISKDDDPNDPAVIWKNFRIPLFADSNPEFKDTKQMFSLPKHAEGVGMTGWDWANRQSLWVGFDFDSIINHQAGISIDELEEVRLEIEKIPWAEVYSSTSGEGYHIYVFFEKGVPTSTHLEHSALARSILTLMSAEAGFNFESKVDCIGSVLWVWHRKNEGTRGLQLLKERESDLPVSKIPKNWKEHIKVTSGKSRRIHSDPEVKTLIDGIQHGRIEPRHKMLLNWFTKKSEYTWWWDSDNFMLVCHTLDLKKAHGDLELKGLYDTLSSGTSDKNCFCFPLKYGRWGVRRFGKKVNEHPCWEVDSNDWTKIVLDELPTFNRAMSFYGGLPNTHNDYCFVTMARNDEGETIDSSTDRVVQAVNDLGIPEILEIPVQLKHRKVTVRHVEKTKKIAIQIEKQNADSYVEGWIQERDYWLKTLNYNADSTEQELDINTDMIVRHCVQNGQDAGWFISIDDEWIEHNRKDVETVLKTVLPDLTMKEQAQHLGKSILSPWRMRSIPFEEEFPANRVWNKNGAKLAVVPEKGVHPTWDELLAHIGKNLDNDIADDPYCKKNAIRDGGDYLFIWLASMFQYPEKSLPYLFLTGEQKTGKTTFHEAVAMLFKDGKGCMDAETALKNESGFNNELDGAILAYIEETDLSKGNSRAYNKIKDWTTSDVLTINTKFKNVYTTKNYLHFIQTANDYSYCPVFSGDTRILFIEVGRLEKEVVKEVLFKQLWEEAPAFMYSLIHYELPPRETRLGLPIIDSPLKREIMEANENPVEEFTRKRVHKVHGRKITLKEFVEQFKIFMETQGRFKELEKYKNSKMVSKDIPYINPIIKGQDPSTNLTTIGNVSWLADDEPNGICYLQGDKLRWKQDN